MILRIAATWLGALVGAGPHDEKAAPRPDVVERLAPAGSKASFTSADSKGALYAAGEPYRFVLELEGTIAQHVTLMVRALEHADTALVRMDVYALGLDGRWQRLVTRMGAGTMSTADAGIEELLACPFERLRVAGSACRPAGADGEYADLPVRVGAFNEP